MIAELSTSASVGWDALPASALVPISNSDRAWLARAERAAATVSGMRHSLGAVLVSGGRVLAVGRNRFRNDPAVIDPTACSEHAEAAALRLAGRAASGATVYVARLNRQGARRMARPCARCAEALFRAGVVRVVYTVDPDRVGCERTDALERIETGERARRRAALAFELESAQQAQ